MSITENIRAGARAVGNAVTGRALMAAPGPELTSSSAMLAPPTEPPLQLGSPWVTSELHTVFADIVGADKLPLTREKAMQVPAVAKARHTICPTLARIPLVVEGSADTEVSAFIEQPDPTMSRFLLLTWTFDDQLFHGVSWWHVTARYASNRIKTVRRVLPGGVTHEQGKWFVYGDQTPPADILRLDGPHEGLLNFASTTLRQASDIEAATAKAARNPVPDIDLHQTQGTTLPKAERTELVQAWVDARRGDSGSVAYTSPNIEARALGQHPERLLISARNAAAVDVARHAGIPADSIDASPEQQTLTYNTAETKMRALIDFGLAAYSMALTSRLSLSDVTPRGTRIVHDFDAVTVTTDSDPSTPAPPAAGSAPAVGSAGGVGPTERTTA